MFYVKKAAAACILMVVLLAYMAMGYAATPYKTYTQSWIYGLSETQTAYEPVGTLIKFGDETLKNANDMRLGPDGNLYIADTGNARILVVTREGELKRIIKDKKNMKDPNGVFVTGAGDLYVADENGRRVSVFDKDGKFLRKYEKPDHPLFGESSPYKPNKVVVDKRGNLYVSSTGNTNGIVQISPNGDGEFLGYFGANMTNVSLMTMIRKAVFTDEQLSRTADVVPTSVVNLSIDEKGMIFTVSQTGDMNTLRKLNVAGKNILDPDWFDNYPAAVTTNSFGNIFMASKNGYVYEYTSEGSMIFVFGSKDDGQQRTGLSTNVTGIVVDDDNRIYLLDNVQNTIQIFAPTEFCSLVHKAFVLFQNGKYEESKEPWQQVLRMNSLFSYANAGLGEALYREGDYENALGAYKNGGSFDGYSDAFWELRSNWLHKNLGMGIIGVAVLALVIAVLRRVNKRVHFLTPAGRLLHVAGSIGIIRKTGFSFYMLKNPYDAAYGIKREGKASVFSAMIVMLLYFLLYVVEKYYSGFLYKSVPDGYFELVLDFVNVYGIYLLLVICCYLVCTITEGEASFKDMFIGAAYSLAPLLLLKPAVILMTNVLTYNESFFITITNVVAYGWTGILLFLSIRYLNDYTGKKTVKVIVLTLFTALICVALLFVVYVLITQFIDFGQAIYGEVVYRFVRR